MIDLNFNNMNAEEIYKQFCNNYIKKKLIVKGNQNNSNSKCC